MRFLVFVISILFAGLVQAQELTEKTDVFEVPAAAGTGLGEVVRSLGRDPNWTQTDWMDVIRKANPENVTADNKIIQPNSVIKVPKEALDQLQYLPGQEPVAVVAPTLTPEPTPALEPVPEPEPVVEKVLAEPEIVLPPEPTPAPAKASAHKFSLGLLVAMETLKAENASNTEMELKPKTGYGVDIDYVWKLKGNSGLRVGARWLSLSYKEPATVTIVHEEENLYQGHLGWQQHISDAFYVYLDAISRSQNEVEFAVGTSTIDQASVTVGQLGVNYALSRRPQSRTSIDVSYGGVFSSDHEGSEVSLGLDYRRNKGLGFGLEYSLRTLDLDDDTADHQYDLAVASILYDF